MKGLTKRSKLKKDTMGLQQTVVMELTLLCIIYDSI